MLDDEVLEPNMTQEENMSHTYIHIHFQSIAYPMFRMSAERYAYLPDQPDPIVCGHGSVGPIWISRL